MSAYSQSSRLGRLSTALGPDVLVLQRFSGQEGMSALFAFEVDCLATSAEIDFDALMGTHATVTLTTRTGERPLDGIVTEAKWLGAGENGQRYRLILRPWAFIAGLRRNQRIFHNKTVVQILEELLGAYADVGALKPQLTADYPVLEYTVQFRESDLDFACRLMERHGISYHFQHQDGQHDMVLTDMAASHASIGARPFHPDEGHHQEDEEHFWQWRPARRITTGAIRLTDYNFKSPNAAMEVDRTGDATYAQGKIESFDWPGGYPDQGRGRTVAALRIDAERGQDRRFEALGDVADLGAGLRVTLSGDQVPGTGGDYLCLAASHSYTSDNYGSGGAQGDALAYRGVYVLMPASAPMLPEQKTPRADVRGPQTAVVVGEGEIDCDEYGRILVKFHWDLAAAHSMRCRVSQNWAGSGWGGMVIPRVGMEVVVEFLDGDPDQPIVTGCVYNGANPAAYPLPAHKTKSVFRSDTHQGSGFNELVFEDAKGQENIALKAQKDMTSLILNDQVTRAKRHVVTSIGTNSVTEIGKNQKTEVGGSVTTVVGGTGLGAATLMAGLAGLAAKTAGLVKKGASEAGSSDANVGSFAAALGQSALGFLSIAGLKGRGGVNGADEGGSDANHAMRNAGASLGESASSLFDVPGTMNTMVANFRSDTTGVVSAEQVGLTKIVNVGASAMEQVGKAKTLTVGETFKTMVGKLIFSQSAKQTLIASEKFTIAGPGGSIEIDASGVTIRAAQLKVLSPSVDFNPGSPAQAEALMGEQAFSEKCRVAEG